MENLEQLSEFLLETLKETKGLVVEQAPDYVRQMLEYASFEATVCVVAFFILLLFSIYLLYKAIKKNTGDLMLIAFFGVILSCVCFVGSGLDLYKIKYAPKVYLMEKIYKSIKQEK